MSALLSYPHVCAHLHSMLQDEQFMSEFAETLNFQTEAKQLLQLMINCTPTVRSFCAS